MDSELKGKIGSLVSAVARKYGAPTPKIDFSTESMLGRSIVDAEGRSGIIVIPDPDYFAERLGVLVDRDALIKAIEVVALHEALHASIPCGSEDCITILTKREAGVTWPELIRIISLIFMSEIYLRTGDESAADDIKRISEALASKIAQKK